ncbi:maleylacetoacetate isomerase [uncultured Ruegeria sp.]|uniref:maleylacetoacetate isomerase n=1 Tax=uncultured Ruegeria sp. TaxID=259304 RepID=UPI0026398E8C|nr:maleylacetoacetate isomerase [uncultured Ruegeria sp.]
MTEVVLYDYWRSSASYRLRIALNLAGIAYRPVVIDLVGGAHRTADHLARNPQGLVPVLDIDGLRLTQSLAILDYLDETRQMGLLPQDPAQRAAARALAQSIAVDIHPVCNLSVARHATQLSAGAGDMPGDWMRHFIRPGLLAFEALLGNFEQSPFCTGDTPGLADICLIPQLYNARRWEVDLTDMPRLLAVEAVCSDHPAFAAAHPDLHASV